VKSIGPAVTDWNTTWTPTGSWTGAVAYTGKWRRVGDMAHYRVGVVASGLPTGSGLTVNLPHTIDTTKVNSASANSDMFGTAHILDSGVTHKRVGQVCYSTTTAVAVLAGDSTSGSNDTNLTPTSHFTFASGDSIWLDFMVPITGWSSGLVLSDSADTRVVAARMAGFPTTSSFTAGANLIFSSVTFDTHGAYSTSTGNYTVQTPGYYRVNGYIRVTGTSGSFCNLLIYKDGSSYQVGQVVKSAGAEVPVSGIVYCNAGQTISLRVNCDYTSAAISGVTESNFHVERLSGPSQIAASDSVSASYSSAAGQTVSNASPIFIGGTKNWDNTSSYNTSTGEFTCPIAGEFEIEGLFQINSVAYVAGNAFSFRIFVDGSSVKDAAVYRATASTTGTREVFGTTSVKCLAGQKITIRLYSDVSTALSTASTANHFTIRKVGNY
jgi:uncharacterized protein (UPF0333 family)